MTDSSDQADIQTHVDLTEAPPTSLGGILRRLGPGLIVAGSIVGSGELIATTATGAQAGFSLLWLIIIGCVIKVFVQVEFGRLTIISGKGTIGALNGVPGPAIKGGGNWLVWFWFAMFLASIGQLGGIVGGVGQALAISSPLTSYGMAYNEYVEKETKLTVARARIPRIEDEAELAEVEADAEQLETDVSTLLANWTAEHGEKKLIPEKVEEKDGQTVVTPARPKPPRDPTLWAALIAVITVGILVYGRYGLIQNFATAMVAMFTLITIVNLFWLQSKPDWSVSVQEIIHGLSFSLPKVPEGSDATPVATALATFGIIGVGATELICYPYWCLEKGYARFTGPREETDAWAARARGWLRVLQWDAWGSMVVYTFATIAFYLLGAAILGRIGQSPEGPEMVRTLAVMYEPVYGAAAQYLFLFGAFAVLYSTFFVANASHARVVADAIGVMGFTSTDDATRRRWVRILSGVFPLACLAVYLVFPSDPVVLVLISGMMQAFMLPMLAVAALYYRFRHIDPRLKPGVVWDAFLWLSSLGMLIAGGWLLYTKLGDANKAIQTWLGG